MLKRIIKKLVPKFLLSAYHWSLAKIAAIYYRHPSDELIVIGVTGTNGKTTTVNFISQILECLDQKTGLASTVNFKVADKEWLNDKKMTMLGRFQTQKLLRQMVDKGCRYAIIETSSQGIDQYRHVGVNYDVAIFTNLSPEHIEAHGGFKNYRAAKEKLFYHLSKSKKKKIDEHVIDKTIISNADDDETDRLKEILVDQFITYGFNNSCDYQGKHILLDDGLAALEIENHIIKTKILGKFNNYNLLAALVSARILGFDIEEIANCQISGVPGRQEFIDNKEKFKILVDYAPEPQSLKHLYKAIELLPKQRLIHVIGSCGGGRDIARQPILGELAGQKASVVIVTNEDPYNDDPQKIIDNVAEGAIKAGKELDKNLFKILDRREAIKKALVLANDDDLVLITGKGAEQFICGANGKKIAHDDRQVVRELLKTIKK
jgi:UDP-N-acetylmuramoyl-L-alanyl-D-glutamate--2,6-diaminopimelate ligase